MASRVFTLTNVTGSRTSPALGVPDTATQGTVVIDGAAISDPTLRCSVSIDFSPDGGVTWAATAPSQSTGSFPVTATFEGASVDKHGTAVTEFGVGADFPPGTNRQVRGTIIIDGVPFTGTVTATAI